MSDRFILLTGCSGGGKSTLLDALSARGFATVPEPGKRIVAQELEGQGRALPWVDLRAFALRAVKMAQADLVEASQTDGLVFFDRGLIDAAAALQASGGPSVEEVLGEQRPYARRVLVCPPWPEIFKTDTERRHGFDAAEEEYHRIRAALDKLGYELCNLPRVSVSERADLVIRQLNAHPR